MNGSGLRVYFNCFATFGEEPSPTYGYFSFGALDDCLVVGFLGGIVPATKIKLQRLCEEQNQIRTYNLHPCKIYGLGYIPVNLAKTWLF
jgi:hypothetical protein